MIVEESLFGGACANRGCNSKALLDAPYEIKALADNFKDVGISGNIEVNWPDLMKLKQQRIAGMSKFLNGKFKEYDLDVAHFYKLWKTERTTTAISSKLRYHRTWQEAYIPTWR